MNYIDAGPRSGGNAFPVFRGTSILLLVFALARVGAVSVAADYEGFEARQTHPIEVAGTKLLALNSPAGLLEIYDLDAIDVSGVPALVAEVPVGVGPVSVRAYSETEVWVVNEVSDSVSVVDLPSGLVVATIPVPDEPSDVLFAGGAAVVSCARSNILRIVDPDTLAELAEIPLQGQYPSSLAKSLDGSRLYVGFLLSGNGTTILPPDRSPDQPDPTNGALPEPPDTASIVSVEDPRVDHYVYDHDLAVIDTTSWEVQNYLLRAGTILRSVAVHPGTGDIFVANMESRNLVKFEPNLKGHFADHRLTKFSANLADRDVFDLNPGIEYETLPNPGALSTALADPAALVFEDNSTAWVAAFATDRIAKVDPADGTVSGRIDLRLPAEGSRSMRGPRGLAIDADGEVLYVLNKISNSITAIDLGTETVITEFPLAGGNPMPAVVAEGRGFLFDARLSGNGTGSCGTCHIDADRDGLAWNLGDPGGEMSTGSGFNSANHELGLLDRPFHPMKGPLVTQTLRNLEGGAPFHWRGDKPTLGDFNTTFVKLLGGELLSTPDFDDLEAYLFSLRHHPNPYRNLDDTLPSTLVGGDPSVGEQLFNLHLNHCAVCHEGPRGSLGNIDDFRLTDSRDNVKIPPLQTTYQRFGFDNAPGGVSAMGFGMNRDGTGSRLPTVHFYELGQLDDQGNKDVAAYVLSFGTGTPASVGQGRTLHVGNRDDAGLLGELDMFESLVAAGNVDLVAEGTAGANGVRLYFDSTSGKYSDGSGGVVTRADLLSAIQTGEGITFTVLLRGQAVHRLNLP